MQEQTKGIVIYAVKGLFNIALTAAILFVAAGRLGWTEAWILLGLIFVTQALLFLILYRISPGLLAERSTAQEGSKKWDVVLAINIVMVLPIVTWIVAGLDERFGWSPPMPMPVGTAAIILFLAGSALITWAMASNKFFSGVVRIQEDRGHQVASSGPYGIIRHPGYLGMLVVFTATPIILGSLWALLPALLIDALIVVRTMLEDKTLQKELTGYAEYTGKVKHRLIPYIW